MVGPYNSVCGELLAGKVDLHQTSLILYCDSCRRHVPKEESVRVTHSILHLYKYPLITFWKKQCQFCKMSEDLLCFSDCSGTSNCIPHKRKHGCEYHHLNKWQVYYYELFFSQFRMWTNVLELLKITKRTNYLLFKDNWFIIKSHFRSICHNFLSRGKGKKLKN